MVGELLTMIGLAIDLVGFVLLFLYRGYIPFGPRAPQDHEGQEGDLFVEVPAEEDEVQRIEQRNADIRRMIAWGFGLVIFGLVLQLLGAGLPDVKLN